MRSLFFLDLDEGTARLRVLGELDDLLQVDALLLKSLRRPLWDELGRDLHRAPRHRHRRLRRRLMTLEHPDLQVRHEPSPTRVSNG